MDAEVLANAEGYRALVALRDESYARLDEDMKDVRAAVEALEAGNRRDRKRGAGWRENMERERQKWVAKIDELFNRLARDFDPKVGTSASVQLEAEAAFADIFCEAKRCGEAATPEPSIASPSHQSPVLSPGQRKYFERRLGLLDDRIGLMRSVMSKAGTPNGMHEEFSQLEAKAASLRARLN
jgi:hypothetical protein